MQTPIIGLSGRKRSGKDTFAEGLIEDHGYERIAFADPLREAALGLDPIVHVEFAPMEGDPENVEVLRLSEVVEAYGWEIAKDRFPEVRRTLQRLGTESIRALDPEFWIRISRQRILAATKPVVVTDMRYPNEADAIDDLGGLLVRIERESLVDDGDSHASELALDRYAFDVVVQNGGTIAELKGAAAGPAAWSRARAQQLVDRHA